MTIETLRAEPESRIGPSPVDAAEMLAGLVNVLIPGDTGWPSASAVGVQALLATRLIEELGRVQFERLFTALLAAGAPFTGHGEDEQVSIARAFETAEPALFGWVRDAAYIAYYESPFVAAAINAHGHPYDLRPHLKGYALPPFDIERQTPRHGRGHYIPTDGVRHLDISGLDLATERTQSWGLKR